MSILVPSPDETELRRVITSIRQLAEGRSNASGTFTLASNATSTAVTAVNCGASSQVVFSPTTSNAASEVASTYIASIAAGSFVVGHASNATANRTFGYIISG